VAVIRRATEADIQAILALRRVNRAYLERWEPDTDPPGRRYERPYYDEWITKDEQYVILEDGAVAGTVQLVNIHYDSFRSAMIGYWVAEAHAGKGLASRAVAEIMDVAFGDLGLHRVEAGTAVANVPSQRVLERNRFTKVGLMREHLLIGGEWVDHYLWERIVGD
jgi:ribosomal-protein-alanine N-acetyltransferase